MPIIFFFFMLNNSTRIHVVTALHQFTNIKEDSTSPKLTKTKHIPNQQIVNFSLQQVSRSVINNFRDVGFTLRNGVFRL